MYSIKIRRVYRDYSSTRRQTDNLDIERNNELNDFKYKRRLC